MNSRNLTAKRSTVAAKLSRRWQRLAEEYLPVTVDDSIWRYSRQHKQCDIRQGWKLHVSATILSAHRVLTACAPILSSCDVLFKGPVSLEELQKLNSGLHYGYSQVGKFLTVYPRSAREAKTLLSQLHAATKREAAPVIPFDCRFRPDSTVFYRYGSFASVKIDGLNGEPLLALKDSGGNLVPDDRYSAAGRPQWVGPLFRTRKTAPSKIADSPLATTYRAFESLSQRGKGGVYKALDLNASPPRLCILKEGRFCGETSWDRSDGASLVSQEIKVLRALRSAGVSVPEVFHSFQLNNSQYLVTEFIEGSTLEQLLLTRKRKLDIEQVVTYAAELTSLITRIHAAGWAWRDCKPANVFITSSNAIRPIDFEGATRLESLQSRTWSTVHFLPATPAARNGRLADLYALGATIYYMLAGELPGRNRQSALRDVRTNTPEWLGELVNGLLSPVENLTATKVGRVLSKFTVWKDVKMAHRAL